MILYNLRVGSSKDEGRPTRNTLRGAFVNVINLCSLLKFHCLEVFRKEEITEHIHLLKINIREK